MNPACRFRAVLIFCRRFPKNRDDSELRLVVQGELRILDGIAAQHHRSWQTRVTLHKTDLPVLAWRALWM